MVLHAPSPKGRIPAQPWGIEMKRVIQVACVIGLGLLASACDKCGNWNINTPQFCTGVNPKG
jgi:hypothetical protein